MNQDAIKVSNVTMRFNLEREKTDNVKEFFIKNEAEAPDRRVHCFGGCEL